MAQPDAIAELRERLHILRRDAARQLAEADHLDAGLLILLGNVGAALVALELDHQKHKRGGDRRAQERGWRDNGMCDLAQLLGADLSLERKAQLIITKSCHYRPSPSDADGSPERQALYRIATSGMALPNSTKQIKEDHHKKVRRGHSRRVNGCPGRATFQFRERGALLCRYRSTLICRLPSETKPRG